MHYCGFRTEETYVAPENDTLEHPRWMHVDWPLSYKRNLGIYAEGYPAIQDLFVDRAGEWLYIIFINIRVCTNKDAVLGE